MSTKFFVWNGGVQMVQLGDRYSDGNPVEFQFSKMPQLAIQGWHNVSPATRAAILARLAAAGWTGVGQSKPDEVA